MEDVIHWITEHKEESSPNRKVSHSHPDPTANEAIGNVVREERRKKHRQRKHPKRECQERNAHASVSGGQRRRSRMRENEVEKQFVEAVRAAGGQALKFTSQSMNGVPDRLVLLLGGKCAFVELKAPGKQMRILQRKRRQQLEALGFPVFCVDRPEQIQPAIHALLRWKPGEPIPQGIGAKIPEMPEVTLPQGNTQSEKPETRAQDVGEEVMPK